VLQLVSDLPQVRVLFKHYPISDICNDKVQGARHDKACQAAAAAECARHQGKFWELEKLLFINQDALDQPDLMFMAEQVGLDTGVFGECMVDEATAKAVRKDVADAHAVGVFATPSFYLQGLRGEEWVSVHDGPEALDVLVRAHLAGTPIPDTPPAGSHTH
jgi:protein-disulfide isomerase